MTESGPIWAVPLSDDGALLKEAARLADRLESEGESASGVGGDATDRPRVVAVVFDGIASLEAPTGTRVDEIIRVVREEGSFRTGSAGVRPRAAALRSVAEAAGAGTAETGEGAEEEKRPRAVLLPSTADGDELAAVAARRLRGGCVTDCLLRVRDGELHAGRPAYEGRAYAERSFERGPPVVSLNPDVLAAPSERTADETPPERTHRVRLDEVEDEEPIRRVDVLDVPEQDLSRAKRIVAGGYGLGDPAGFDVVDDLAAALNASVGASRPPADEGWVPYDRQIGVTGKEIDVDLYVPCAISGDPYHMRSVNADHQIAINEDSGAIIFIGADLGIVGDVFEYGPAIVEAIRAARDDAEAEEVVR